MVVIGLTMILEARKRFIAITS